MIVLENVCQSRDQQRRRKPYLRVLAGGSNVPYPLEQRNTVTKWYRLRNILSVTGRNQNDLKCGRVTAPDLREAVGTTVRRIESDLKYRKYKTYLMEKDGE